MHDLSGTAGLGWDGGGRGGELLCDLRDGDKLLLAGDGKQHCSIVTSVAVQGHDGGGGVYDECGGGGGDGYVPDAELRAVGSGQCSVVSKKPPGCARRTAEGGCPYM